MNNLRLKIKRKIIEYKNQIMACERMMEVYKKEVTNETLLPYSNKYELEKKEIQYYKEIIEILEDLLKL